MPYLRDKRSWQRAEVRKGTSGSVEYWPVHEGELSRPTGDATYEVRDEGGAVLASGTVAPTDVAYGTATIAKYVVPIPAISDAQENCQVQVEYTEPATSATVQDIRLLDVVATPLPSLVTLADLLRARPFLSNELAEIARELYGDTTQAELEQVAADYAYKARSWLRHALRKRADADGEPRPAQILSRAELTEAETYAAIAEVYESLASPDQDLVDEGEPLDQRAATYRRKAYGVINSMAITYDTGDDGVPDEQTRPSSLGTVTLRRMQG